MKKILLMLAAFVAFVAFADTWTDPETGITWTYTISDGEASVGGGSRESTAVPTSTIGDIVIPSTLGGCPVTSIGDSAFCDCSSLTSVEIPSSVTSIDYCAFTFCSGLTSMTIPLSVTSIGDYAFYGCSGLTSVTIPNSVTSIGDSAFEYCSGLTIVTIPLGVMSIGDYAFCDCSSLTSVEIPSSVTSIGSYAFQNCSGLTSVTIPSSATSIGDYAFKDCSALTSVTIPSSVKTIESGTFGNCYAITNVTISEGVTSIRQAAFTQCNNLKSVTIPASMTDLAFLAFEECSRELSEVVFLGNAPNTGYPPFSYVENGCVATVYEDTTGWGSDKMWCRMILKRIKRDGGPYKEAAHGIEWAFMVTNGAAHAQSASYSDELSGVVTIPATLGGLPLTSISEEALACCEGQNAIDFEGAPPKGLNDTTIKTDAVIRYNVKYEAEWSPVIATHGWTNTKPYVPQLPDGGPYFETVDGIKWMFEVTSGEASLSWRSLGAIPQSVSGAIVIPPMLGGRLVTSIGDDAFDGCLGLTHITIPDAVTSMGDYVFNCCFNLMAVDFEGAPPDGVADADIITYAAIRYNVAYEDEWLPVIQQCGWTNAKPYVPVKRDGGPYTEMVDGIEWTFMVTNGAAVVTSIPKGTVGAVTIPSMLGGVKVTCVGERAFSGCGGITSVTVPACVSGLFNYAFADCGGLREVTFEGDAPGTGDLIFSNTPLDMVVKIKGTTTGWASWNGRRVQSDGSEVADLRLTVTNIVIHYIQTSELSPMAAPITPDTGIVNVMTEIEGGKVAIPDSWSDNYPGFEAKFGSNFTDALTKETGKFDANRKPLLVWHDYVAGTDPTDEEDQFRASVTMVGGKPVISYTPALIEEEKAKRVYTTYGKVKLQDKDWVEIPAGQEDNYNFFKVSVRMK